LNKSPGDSKVLTPRAVGKLGLEKVVDSKQMTPASAEPRWHERSFGDVRRPPRRPSLPLSPALDPWEVNTERSYYEEQVLSPDKKHEGMDILVSEKAPPHESV
jgi:hypothetical protein